MTLRTGAAVVRALIRAPLRIAILAGAKAVLKLDGHTGDGTSTMTLFKERGGMRVGWWVVDAAVWRW